MLTIILKISIIWSLLLALYFVMLSKEKVAKWNRLYLLFSLCLGIVIPFLENPFALQQGAFNTETVPHILSSTIVTNNNSETQTQLANQGQEIDWFKLLFYVWLIGAIVQVFILVKNAFQLYFLKKYSTLRQHHIADYYTNDNTAAAFSFGKTIFLPNDNYSEKELDLILQHEHNHYKHRHWIDNVLLELLQIIFWAHPLFYFFKKQIKLVHEYEVDADINAADGYEYGRLLLAQNNKTYKTVLVHTLNFSPLKKRIAMMTNTRKANKWKYLLALPLVGLCFTLMSAQPKTDERIRVGNITTYKGNKFEWQKPENVDIALVDPVSGEEIIKTVKGDESVIQCNGKEVFNGINTLNYPNPDNYYASEALREIAMNISKAIMDRKSEFPDALTHLNLYNIIVDKNFKVLYFDVQLMGATRSDTAVFGINKPSSVLKTLDKILSNAKLINPKGLKSDKSFYNTRAQAALGVTTFRFEPVDSK